MCRAKLRRRYGETKRTLQEFAKTELDAAYGGVSYRRREAIGSRRVTPMCAVKTLMTLLTMSNTRWATQRNEKISKTAVPTIFPSKLSD